jgi:hypothetical protein
MMRERKAANGSGQRGTANGEQQTGNGKLQTGCGKRQMANGERQTGSGSGEPERQNGECKKANDTWQLPNVKWETGSGEGQTLDADIKRETSNGNSNGEWQIAIKERKTGTVKHETANIKRGWQSANGELQRTEKPGRLRQTRRTERTGQKRQPRAIGQTRPRDGVHWGSSQSRRCLHSHPDDGIINAPTPSFVGVWRIHLQIPHSLVECEIFFYLGDLAHWKKLLFEIQIP